MALWDFVKDAGKSVLGKAEAAEASPEDATKRKVEALKAELKTLNLDSDDVHLTLKGDVVKVENLGADQETMEKLVIALGNVEGIAKVEANIESGKEPVFHTVGQGETLSQIAEKYLGSAGKYQAIFEANRPMLSDPDKIYPGQVLRIPA